MTNEKQVSPSTGEGQDDLIVLTGTAESAGEELVTILGEDFEYGLNNAFRRLKIGRIGLPTADGSGVVTARNIVLGYIDFASKKGKLSEEEALARVLGMYSIPTVEAVKIGILWGNAYPKPRLSSEEQPATQPLLDLNARRRPSIIERVSLTILRMRRPPV